MFQFSLRNLLVAVAAVAIETAALLNANEWWASVLWGVAFALLVLAGLMALFRREAKRAFWSGCLISGGCYLVLLLFSMHVTGGAFFSPLNHSHLVTTRITGWAYSRLPESKRSQFLPPPLPSSGGIRDTSSMGGSAGSMPGSGGGMAGSMGGMAMGPPEIPNPSYVESVQFLEVGHAVWQLLLSWLGGTVALWLYRARENSSNAATPNRIVNG